MNAFGNQAANLLKIAGGGGGIGKANITGGSGLGMLGSGH